MSEEITPAKVIVVREENGRDLRYAADGWDAEEAIDITSNGQIIATYPPGRWLRVHQEGAITGDLATRKLGIAMQALRTISATVLEADDKRRVTVAAARDALEQIEIEDL